MHQRKEWYCGMESEIVLIPDRHARSCMLLLSWIQRTAAVKDSVSPPFPFSGVQQAAGMMNLASHAKYVLLLVSLLVKRECSRGLPSK